MNSLQILQCLGKISKQRLLFYDVIAYDGLPNTITHFPQALFVNTKPAHDPGEHWLGLYWQRCSTGEIQFYFLDSYGNDIDRFPEIKALGERTAHHMFNFVSSHQALVSATCGPFALYCIYRLHIERIKWAELSSSFNFRNHILNDLAMYRFIGTLCPRIHVPFSIFRTPRS